jgi:hypothetical protein
MGVHQVDQLPDEPPALQEMRTIRAREHERAGLDTQLEGLPVRGSGGELA